jgi:hypothetical protein
MYKKLISSILVVALLNLVGCYSTAIVHPNQFKMNEKKGDNPSEIIVRLSNHKEYLFGIGRYIITEDSLYGKGAELVNDNYRPFEGSIPISQIQSIEYEKKDSGKTTSLIVISVLGGLLIIGILLAVGFAVGLGESSPSNF